MGNLIDIIRTIESIQLSQCRFIAAVIVVVDNEIENVFKS